MKFGATGAGGWYAMSFNYTLKYIPAPNDIQRERDLYYSNKTRRVPYSGSKSGLATKGPL
jgi:hypothetical protein